MASSLKLGCVSRRPNDNLFKSKTDQHSSPSLKYHDTEIMDLSCRFMGQSLVFPHQKSHGFLHSHSPANFSVQGQESKFVSKGLRWWEKALMPNMIEIQSTQEFVDTLKSADDRLVIVDFYSPGCGGCKSLHPKICQLAESNPDAIFLKVNYEELKPMCRALHIHVLPFFRFYRGSEGRICSFSCTISTIKKFKDALAKHSSERCNLGSAKGLDEAEIQKLTSIGELSQYPPTYQLIKEGEFDRFIVDDLGKSDPLSIADREVEAKEENNAMLVA